MRIPSGVSYVIENRRAMTQAFSALFSDHRVHPVDSYPSRLFSALLAAAPRKAVDPVSWSLSPGVHNAAYFEHVLLARMMGIELVEGRDLVCRSNHVYMRTTNGERAVHVIYRRVDDDWLDPLQFRPDTVIGVAGLVNAARAGNVVISNGIGNGVADDKLVYTFVPEFIRFYLGEEPLLDNVETYRLEDPTPCAPTCWLRSRISSSSPSTARGARGSSSALRRRSRDQGAAQGDQGRAAQLHRPASRGALDAPDLRGGLPRVASHRSAALRGQRRRGRVGAAGRSHARRAGGG